MTSSHLTPVWLHHYPSRENHEFRMGRDGANFLAEWAGVGTLRVGSNEGAVELVPVDGAPPEVVARIRDGAAKAFVRHVRGELTLHASAVAFGDRAIAFVGDSGAGKSTIAAHLCARHGASLVSDDLLFVDMRGDDLIVTPTAHAHRLLADARRDLGATETDLDKRDVAAPRSERDPVRLVAIASLAYADDDAIAFEPMRGARAFRALSESLFRLVLDDTSVQKRDFDRLADMTGRIPIVLLRRPRSLDAMRRIDASFFAGLVARGGP